MNELWELENLKTAFERVEASDKTYEQVTEELETAYEVSSWLLAEATYNQKVATWLQHEKRWHLTQHLIENNPAYRAAEAGWLRMKEFAPALDGVSRFGDLSPILQARYAVFAEAAIRATDRIEFLNYEDHPNDDGPEYDDLGPYCEQCNDYH
jgi:hypothetical protein